MTVCLSESGVYSHQSTILTVPAIVYYDMDEEGPILLSVDIGEHSLDVEEFHESNRLRWESEIRDYWRADAEEARSYAED